MQERSCGTVLFTVTDGEPKYLLIRARDGYCGFPKGHMEQGETEQQTALREVKEETCVQAEIIYGFRRVVVYRMPNGNQKRVVYFLAQNTEQEAHRNPEEFLKVMVLPYGDAVRALTFENDRAILRAAEKFMRQRT